MMGSFEVKWRGQVCTFEGLLRDTSCQHRGKNVRIKKACQTLTLTLFLRRAWVIKCCLKIVFLFVLFLLLWLIWKMLKNIIKNLKNWSFSSLPPLREYPKNIPPVRRWRDNGGNHRQVVTRPALHSGLWLRTVSHQVCVFTLGKGVFLLLLLPVSQWFHGYATIKTVFSGGFSKSLFSWKLSRDASAMGHPRNQQRLFYIKSIQLYKRYKTTADQAWILFKKWYWKTFSHNWPAILCLTTRGGVRLFILRMCLNLLLRMGLLD